MPTGDTERRAARGGLWVLLTTGWVLVVGLSANIVLARLLAPEVFGTFALGLFFAGAVRLQNKLGLPQAYIQQQPASLTLDRTYISMELLLAVGGVVLTLLVAPLLLLAGYDTLLVPVVVVLGLAACCEGVSGIGVYVLEKRLRFAAVGAMQAVLFPLSYAVPMVLALHGGGVWSLVAQPLVYYSSQVVGVLWLLRHDLPALLRRPWLHRPTARHLLRFGATVGGGLLAGWLLTNIDTFYAGTLVGVAALGLYDRAYRTAQWVALLLLHVLRRAALVAFSQLQHDSVRLRRSARLSVWLVGMLACPVAAAVVVTAPDLLRVLYGAQWVAAAPYLQVLAIATLATPLNELVRQVLLATGHPRRALAIAWGQAAVLLLVGVPLTLAGGLLGTCLAVAVALLVGVLGSAAAVWRQYGLTLFVPLLVPLAVGAVVLAAAVAVQPWLAPLVPLVRLLLLGGGTVAGFYLLVLAVQPRTTARRVRTVWGVLRAGASAA